jgi:phage tail-like protein
MAQPDYPEILVSCRFYLQLELDGSNDFVDGIFMDCKGFKTTQEVIEFAEVTPQKWGQGATKGRVKRTKVPGNLKTQNITLRRGLSISKTLWNWFEAVEKGNWAKQRRNGSITIYDQTSKQQVKFDFSRAWPTSYTISDLSSSSNDYEIEELELACEDFRRNVKGSAIATASSSTEISTRTQVSTTSGSV